MPETIVCGVDQSEAADSVADTARWLANRLQTRLVLIHVVEEPIQEAEALVTSIRVRLSLGARDDVRLVEGSPQERLLAAVEQDGADLLVVGSRGRGAIRSALFGSVSRSLATSAPCPVVVVPPGFGGPGVGDGDGDASIVCGIDGSEHALAAARLGADLAGRIGLRLLLVHALPDLGSVVSYPGARSTVPPLTGQPDERDRLAKQIIDDALSTVHGAAAGILETGRPWEVLELVADREGGQLLVVAARGRSGLQAALFGSVATEVAGGSRRPVVVLPEPAESRVGQAQASG